MMFQIQLVFASVLLIAGSFIVVMNWFVVIHWFTRRKHSSWIPLAGGILASIGIITLPYAPVRLFFWIPLIVDWGCIPGILYSAAAFIYFRCVNKKN